ncbi:MAG: class I SAM-dependent methyltransferase [Terriglobia bacterium]
MWRPVSHLRSNDIVSIALVAFGALILPLLGWYTLGPVSLIIGPIISLFLILVALAEVYRSSQETAKEIVQIYPQLAALMSVLSCLKITHPIPPLRGWAAGPDFISLCISAILAHKPQNVIECGSGASTVLMCYGLKQVGSGRIWSLEHDENFARTTKEHLAAHGLEEQGQVIHAPLQQVSINGKSWRWYDISIFDRVAPIDLLVVDGPPGNVGPKMRYPALPLLYPLLSPEATIIVDDARREDEEEMINDWLAEFKDFTWEPRQTETGAMILRRRANVSAPPKG